MTWEIACELEPTPAEVFAARHLLDRANGALSADRLDDARLIISELVSNAIRHADRDGGIRLIARWNGTALRLEVCSSGAFREPASHTGDGFHTGGWGLRLVEALADRWGIESGPETVVWAEVSERPLPATS